MKKIFLDIFFNMLISTIIYCFVSVETVVSLQELRLLRHDERFVILKRAVISGRRFCIWLRQGIKKAGEMVFSSACDDGWTTVI